MFISDIAPSRQTSPNQGNERNTCPHRRRPSLAFALALMALVVALSSGAYAATTAQKNTIVSKSIKNGQVKTQDLAADAISSDKISDATIRGSDLAADVVSSDKIANATIRGSDLAADVISSDKIADATILGADLAEGSVGAGSLGTITTYLAAAPATSDADGVANGGDHGVTSVSAFCPAGSVPISGGATWVDPSNPANGDENFYLQASHRVAGGWTAIGIVDMGAQGTIRLRTYVDCLMPAGDAPN